MKATAVAPSNIAFIKYWGRRDESLKLPTNASISMNLSGLTTKTTVEFSKDFSEDKLTIDVKSETGQALEKVSKHLDRVRKLAGISEKAKVFSENSFPSGTGLSSSASGFAALTLAATKAVGMELPEKELSILARQGSGSACRSIPDGFVEWVDGDSSETSCAVSLYPADYWDIVDIAIILTDQVKDVSTSAGQKLAHTSPFFEARLKNLPHKIEQVKKAISDKNFTTFGEITEAEALEMHAIMLTSNPALIYWNPATLLLMKAVQQWRNDGISCYFTLNTGQNIHILCQKKDLEIVQKKLKTLDVIQKSIVNYSSSGARLVDEDLF
jgi:diphosphomevalonate decarboxylase